MRKYRKQIEKNNGPDTITLHDVDSKSLENEQWIIDTGNEILRLAKDNEWTVNKAYENLFYSVLNDWAETQGRKFGQSSVMFDLSNCTPGQIGSYFVSSLQALGYEPPVRSIER